MGILRYNKPVKGASFTGHVFVDISTDMFRTKAASSVKMSRRWSTEGENRMKSYLLTHSLINQSLEGNLVSSSELEFGKRKQSPTHYSLRY